MRTPRSRSCSSEVVARKLDPASAAGRLLERETEKMSSRQRWTLVAACVATFMLLIDITVVNVALPEIQRELTRASPTCSG